MTLTKKHFKAIASAIKDSKSKEDLAERLIILCREDNDRFDEVRFREAMK
jgi:hypothetical protein